MDCCFWLIPLGLLLASLIFVRVGYQFYKDRRAYRNWIGFLLMFIGLTWPLLLCGGFILVDKLTHRNLDLNKVKAGMTGDDVRVVWGEPSEVITTNDGALLFWHYYSSVFDFDGIKVAFDARGRVEGWNQMGR
jgi:hypothetical protein